MQQTQQISNTIVENALDDKEKLQSQVTKLKEKAIINYFELLHYMLSEHKGVSKIAIFLKVVLFLRQILKKPTLVPIQSKK